MKSLLILATLLAATKSHANTIDGWQLGLQLTSDADTQQARIGGGVHRGAWRFGLVLDAQPFADGSDDIDAVAEWSPVADSWSLLAGWRTCSIFIERGRQWHQNLLLGASGALPSLFDGRIQPSFGAALTIAIVRHGDELETDWISLESQRHVKDTASVNLFLRFEYVSAL
jgi:hypothetical protein